jgi:hypothetical protein
MPQDSTRIVAHIFRIPISFEFRTAKIQWEEARANVIGWRKDDTTQTKPSHLIGELWRGGGKTKIAIPLSKLPVEERKHCLATLGRRRSDEIVKEICSSLELPYFIHNYKTYFGEELKKHSLPNDAWHLRNDFLSVKADSKKTISFLNNWGRWVPLRNYVDASEIAELQLSVRAALTEAPEKWFDTFGFPTMTDSRSAKFPYFTMLTDASQVAIRMATTIDLLQQIEFKTCARLDCAKPFPVKSKRQRVYCTQYCAHLESVRRGRTVRRGG